MARAARFRSAGVTLGALRVAGVAAALTHAPSAWAQPERPGQSVGDTGGAMPGFVRVGVAGPFDTGLVLAGLAGYGYSGAAIADSDRHHRATLDLASSFRPLPWLALAARFTGRYDRHTDTGTGSGGDSGWVGDPRVAVRASAPVGGGLWLAAHAGLWVPGRDVPSLDPAASTVDLVGLVSWSPPAGRFSLGVQGGFRFDRSARSVDRPDQLSASDRMALGVSESDAVLLGAGAAFRTGATEWIGEWSWDALVGDRAPERRSWPMRLGAGARHWLTPVLAVQLQMEVSLAGTPRADEADRLYPIEPRFQALAGISFQPGRQRDRGPAAHLAAAGVARRAGAASSGRAAGRVAVVVTNLEGGPLSGAEVVVQSTARPGLAARAERTGADGRAEIAGIESGPAQLRIAHPKHLAESRDISIAPGEVSALRIALEPALPPGQLRGVVRSFDRGRPLAAELVVKPIGLEIRCDSRGQFEVDLPPGEYEVSVGAPGYRAQHRRVRIEQDGVTILNADLRR